MDSVQTRRRLDDIICRNSRLFSTKFRTNLVVFLGQQLALTNKLIPDDLVHLRAIREPIDASRLKSWIEVPEIAHLASKRSGCTTKDFCRANDDRIALVDLAPRNLEIETERKEDFVMRPVQPVSVSFWFQFRALSLKRIDSPDAAVELTVVQVF